MTDYNKSVNFAVKDTLTAGDPNKIVSGAEIDTEFNNISSASTTKADKVGSATANNFASLTAQGNIADSGKDANDFADATDTENRLSTNESDISSLQSNKANKVSGATANNIAFLDSNGDLVDLNYNTNQSLKTTDNVTFSTVNTGFGNNELYPAASDSETQAAASSERFLTPSNLAAIVPSVGQSWQQVNRSENVLYVNTTNRPICAAVTHDGDSFFQVNGVNVYEGARASSQPPQTLFVLIPAGATFEKVSGDVYYWAELK